MLVLKVQKLNRVTYFMTEKLCFSNQYTANNVWLSGTSLSFGKLELLVIT